MTTPLLPGDICIIDLPTSIYNGYEGLVQRIESDKVAVLIDKDPWEKMITMRIKDLKKTEKKARR